MRKVPLATDCVYHIFTKSIDKNVVFKENSDYIRLIEAIKYYIYETLPFNFAAYCKLRDKNTFISKYDLNSKKLVVDIIAYCIMPTHIHLVLKQLVDNGIFIFLRKLLNSYTRYYNIKNERSGPLWQGRFKNVLVDSNEQLLHLTRYVHLNPTTAGIVKNPEDWPYSSYLEYLNISNDKICNYYKYLDIDMKDYKEFVDNRKDYQRELGLIKHLTFEE
ncbi:MAG: transposase [Deferribacterota bacterium]|nr:transposase [Deferribacterota bacterium]